jgi:hypothetical protein
MIPGRLTLAGAQGYSGADIGGYMNCWQAVYFNGVGLLKRWRT